MASFYKKLAVVVAFALALLIASNGEETSSFGGSALCDLSTGVVWTSDASCVTLCKEKAGEKYVFGYCSPGSNVAVAGGRRSCICSERCAAQSTPPPLEKEAGMAPDGNLN